ncbi:hypothetical protein KY285_004535 [Solanum tuberosum]|nr:hypothetical protein KY285_004535 [Solanum tuberosum]
MYQLLKHGGLLVLHDNFDPLLQRVEKEIGPAHDRRFICSVQIRIAEGMLFVMGDEKSRDETDSRGQCNLEVKLTQVLSRFVQ